MILHEPCRYDPIIKEAMEGPLNLPVIKRKHLDNLKSDLIDDEKLINNTDNNNELKNSNNNNNSNSEWDWTLKDLKWTNVILIPFFHAVALYAYIFFPYIQHYKTFIWC